MAAPLAARIDNKLHLMAGTYSRGAATKFEKLNSYHAVPVTLELEKKCVSGMAIHEVLMWHFVVGVQTLVATKKTMFCK